MKFFVSDSVCPYTENGFISVILIKPLFPEAQAGVHRNVDEKRNGSVIRFCN